ncbi:MAG: hypothetical protein NT159_19935 [Proteobacteria bacterium]|nr:hypothetical protein [Pseudomonadota bacterium]
MHYSIPSVPVYTRWLILLTLSALSAEAAADTDAQNVDHSSIEQREALAIATSGDVAQRKGKLLTLQLASGDLVKLADGNSCSGSNDCHSYAYVGLLGNKQFVVVEERFYEGGNTLLISRQTGAQYNVHAEPHLSPNGKYIVSASEAEAYNSPGVYLWEVRNGGLIGRYLYEPTNYELYRFSRWKGSNEVQLIRTTHAEKHGCPDNTLVELTVRLVARRSGWELENGTRTVRSTKDCFQEK